MSPPPYIGPMERKSDYTPFAVQRVVMLGYMCSGKSTVGQVLARRLEWEFLDYDVEIERREDRTVSAIIETEGEEYFRAAEAGLTEEAATQRMLVMAPGGAWITRPELLQQLGPGTLAVWLRVTPEETARRLMEDTIDRPFKDLADPVGRIAEMQAERAPLYRLADHAIPTDGRSTEEIAFEIEQVVRTRGIVRRE